MKKIVELNDPQAVAQLVDCYTKIDYYYQMIDVAERKRDLLISKMSLTDIQYACYKSSRK